MQIRWLDEIELTVVENYDEENDCVEEATHIVHAGEVDEVDVIDEQEDFVAMQFGDGSCAYAVQRSWFEEVKA